MKLILASQSPQRFALMQKLGLDFEAAAPDFVEISQAHLSPEEETLSLAKGKAASLVSAFPEDLIIGADTLVALGDLKLGKPRDESHAFEILSQLKGQDCRVITGVVLYQAGTFWKDFFETSWVKMRDYSEAEIRDYVATGEPMGKAGACSVQGLGKSLVKEIKGDLDNVIGLPLGALKKALENHIFI